ncbi:MAG: IS256 family transposase [Defluviicoccus sp.]|nr:IS256 family transposase [Defluviicoccus sp.]
MAKHDRRKRSSQPPDSRTASIQVPLPVLSVLDGAREAFHGLCITTGLQVLQAMMEGDRDDLCGPKGRHQVERPAWRGGSVASQVTLGGRHVAVPRLRVRSADGEVALPSFQWAAATDPLDEHTLAAVAAGVSTRRYAGTLDPVPAEVAERGASSSAVSRRFVALSAKRLQSFLSRPLGELDLRVVCIDGKVFREHCMVVALGIDTQGCKHVLGLREGATETAAVASGLLSDLVTRGLPTDRSLLFVIDGAPGLRRAISDVFGSHGVVQRCQVHKLRNVIGHLPERLHASVGKALRDAWGLDSADRATRVLKRLAGSLERDHPGAAASIREGLEETLTVKRLGLTGTLERTLRTTNIIENLMSSVEGYTRRVKRWRGGGMIQRWVASALVEAEPRFRRVRGYRDLRYLVAALDALAPPAGAVADVA